MVFLIPQVQSARFLKRCSPGSRLEPGNAGVLLLASFPGPDAGLIRDGVDLDSLIPRLQDGGQRG